MYIILIICRFKHKTDGSCRVAAFRLTRLVDLKDLHADHMSLLLAHIQHSCVYSYDLFIYLAAERRGATFADELPV